MADVLQQGKPVRSMELSDDEYKVVKGFSLLTIKPVIYIANMSDEEIANPEQNEYYMRVVKFAESENNEVVPVCAKIEEELSELNKDEKDAFLQELGIAESGLDKVIKSAYRILGLCTYFTAGVKEVRAWTFVNGMSAPECAGIIHSDFQRGFIRAEAFSFHDIDELGSEQAVKEAGKLRSEGKDYKVKDGDVLHFRFNV